MNRSASEARRWKALLALASLPLGLAEPLQPQQITFGCSPPMVLLAGDTVVDTQSFEGCEIQAGPNYAVSGPDGDLTLRAGVVALDNGFEVSVDGSLVIDNFLSATIYVSDWFGAVVAYDTLTDSATFLGSLDPPVVRVKGLAYEYSSRTIFVLDTGDSLVYSMDPATGNAAPFLGESTDLGAVQGGAVKGDLLYSIDEKDPQEIRAFSLLDGTETPLTGTFTYGHSHSVGIDATTGQLYGSDLAGDIFPIDDDGNSGAPILQTGFPYYDIDFLAGDFVGVSAFWGLRLIDGTTGIATELLSNAELTAIGAVAPETTGVTVRLPDPLIPQ